jgi:hypothetical protein
LHFLSEPVEFFQRFWPHFAPNNEENTTIGASQLNWNIKEIKDIEDLDGSELEVENFSFSPPNLFFICSLSDVYLFLSLVVFYLMED